MQERVGIWPRHAAQWQRVGPPLRPAAEDLAHLEACIAAWSRRTGRAAPRALLLGVTPELATLAWPRGTTLVACDRALPMIRNVWPGDTAWRHAVCADWLALPCRTGRWDLVLGDGVLNVLPGIAHYGAAVDAVAALLAPGARVLLRLFVRPPSAESVDAVFAAAAAGAIGSFHTLKWRLAMAVQGGRADAGVALDDIWQAWHAHVADARAFAAARGWSRAAVDTIEAYRGEAVRYSFPSVEELEACFAPVFRSEPCRQPAYELGERCRRYVLAARAVAA